MAWLISCLRKKLYDSTQNKHTPAIFILESVRESLLVVFGVLLIYDLLTIVSARKQSNATFATFDQDADSTTLRPSDTLRTTEKLNIW